MTEQIPVYVGLAAPMMAAAYYLWKVQHSLIGPMDRRITRLEKTIEYERQERGVCEWKHRRLVRWLADSPGSPTVPDNIIYDRPPNATLQDPFLEED